MLHKAGVVGLIASAIGAPYASAIASSRNDGVAEEIAVAPPTYKANGVTVDERLGARLPLDARFRTSEGKVVTLGDVISPPGNSMPTILTFNYSNCPMLCNLQLNGLQSALPGLAIPVDGMRFRVGTQFRIVTIGLEPSESPVQMEKTRERWLAQIPANHRVDARAGWTFLVAETSGDASQIRRVAAASGFSYIYVPDRAEWAHPAALIFLSAVGGITRYVYGIEFDDAVMRESLVKAGISESATAVGFMNRCYHYDPDASSYARVGVIALRFGAAGFLAVLGSVLALTYVLRRNKRLQLGHVEIKQ